MGQSRIQRWGKNNLLQRLRRFSVPSSKPHSTARPTTTDHRRHLAVLVPRPGKGCWWRCFFFPLELSVGRCGGSGRRRIAGGGERRPRAIGRPSRRGASPASSSPPSRPPQNPPPWRWCAPNRCLRVEVAHRVAFRNHSSSGACTHWSWALHLRLLAFRTRVLSSPVRTTPPRIRRSAAFHDIFEMSPSFARNRLLLMAIAAVLLPIAVVSAAPTQTTDFYNQTTGKMIFIFLFFFGILS